MSHTSTVAGPSSATSPCGSSPAVPPLVDGQVVVGSYPTYDKAQRAMDFLADQDFPVAKSAIIGSDLRTVETIVARLTWARAAAGGAGSGAWFGLLVSLLLGLFGSGANPVLLAVGGAVYGALFGAVFALVAYAGSRGRRDFVSRRDLVAARYDIVTEPDVADDARNLLIKHGWRTS
ncbi:general stress protein [Actinomadura opuntiae]|uniref:general stress protein n=1 Tax=Actinomadura sp. OS1-43 TaxID=604315 RepID=UPI00255A7404|nr:general stress protein [Actinomadura sp. OS1-43]MDL4813107.1 hypothetical protein [Actinomadura sp. OS1-43]